jgi:hypothetical protein
MVLLLAAGASLLLRPVTGRGSCSHLCRRCSSGLQQLVAAAAAAAGLAPQQQHQQQFVLLQLQDLQEATMQQL